MTRARDVADTQDNLGGAVPPVVAGKNFVINGGFDFWQRGTSFTTNYIYTADRWYYLSAAATGRTVSRQLTNDSTNLPNIQYCARIQRNSGNTATNGLTFSQPIETVNSIPLAGKTVTLSFYARVGTGSSSTSLTVFLCSGTGTDQNQQLSGYTGQLLPINTTITATTSWQRFTFTATVSSTATEVQPIVEYVPTGTAGTNDYFEITGVQLELGSAATPFSRAGGTIQGELAACQRYYQRYKADSVFDDLGYSGRATSSTVIYANRIPYVPFRTVPSSVDFANVTWITQWGAGTTAISAIALSAYVSADTPLLTFTTTGVSSGSNYIILAGNSTDAYIGLSAEL